VIARLREHLNLVVVLVGFAALEAGVGLRWSAPVAAIVGGTLLMIAGLVPYVGLLRRRG
jgi:hypothetical protein